MTQNPELDKIIEEFEGHLKESIPALDKFERASILNELRKSLTSYATHILKECVPREKVVPLEGSQAMTLNFNLAISEIKERAKKFDITLE